MSNESFVYRYKVRNFKSGRYVVVEPNNIYEDYRIDMNNEYSSYKNLMTNLAYLYNKYDCARTLITKCEIIKIKISTKIIRTNPIVDDNFKRELIIDELSSN